MNQDDHRHRGEGPQCQPRRNPLLDEFPPMQHPHMPRHPGPQLHWHNQSHPNQLPHRGPRHFYPIRQVFMQHGPFGNDGNRFHPARFPHFPNPVNFQPHGPPLNYNIEHRWNGNRQQFEMVGGQDMHRYRHDYMAGGGRSNNYNDRYLRGDYGQGARPKTGGRFQKDKHRSGRKKKQHSHGSCPNPASGSNENTSSNFNGNLEEEEKQNLLLEASGSRGSQSLPSLTAQLSNGAKTEADHVDNAFSQSSTGSNNSVNFDPCESELEGAVGGTVIVNNSDSGGSNLPEGGNVEPSIDKNLIDEGAICDLDNMFQHQEYSRINGEFKGLYPSDDDDCVDVGYSENLDSITRLDSDNSTDEDSGSDKQFSSQEVLSSLSPLCSATGGICSGNERTGLQNDRRPCNVVAGNEVEDGDDNGDFIDTDLPAQSFLSSSDEMDNASSSERDEEAPCFPRDNTSSKHSGSDINCNKLPCPGSSLLPEALTGLSIDASDRSCPSASKPSSLFQVPKISRKSKRHCKDSGGRDGSSDSDTEEISHHRVPPACRPKTRAHAVGNCPPTGACGDGAAASQAVLHVLQKEKRAGSNSLSPRLPVSPPGADSEIPPPSQPCDDSLGAGAIPAPSEVAVPTERLPLSAVTASCEPSVASGLATSSEPTSCGTTASGGACCPPGHSLSRCDDSSACCQPTLGPGTNHGAGVETSHLVPDNVASDSRQGGESHSASSYNAEQVDSRNRTSYTKDKSADGSGPEDPSLSHDSGDSIDMVLLPMEEEIEPVLRMGDLLCNGGTGMGDVHSGSAGLTAGLQPGQHLCEDHESRCPLEQGHLRGAVPSKEFYELIKTVSTTDSYMRFYDKDGHDVQREPASGSDDEQSREERLRVDRVMIWNEYEAYVMQFKQIAVSACGQTAVLNVLKALKIPCEKSAVCKVIQGSLRKEDAGIPEYLFSRAVAGTTAEELMSGIEALSGGTVGGRFFPFWPPRKIKLLQWLAYWMKRGAIPMATLNLQQGPHSLWQVPDSWHHQMVYGVSHQGLYLTNPLEIVSERSAMKQLCSDSVLMVRRQDIISRYRKTTDLGELLAHPDTRWSTMNVLGQVVNVLREFNMPSVPGYRLQVTSHVSIPASYKAGITLFMRKDKAAWTTLLNAPDVPIEGQGSIPSPPPQQEVAGAGAL